MHSNANLQRFGVIVIMYWGGIKPQKREACKVRKLFFVYTLLEAVATGKMSMREKVEQDNWEYDGESKLSTVLYMRDIIIIYFHFHGQQCKLHVEKVK